MRVLTAVECRGQDVVIEVESDGSLLFHDYDIESDMALVELGFEKSKCVMIAEDWKIEPIKTFIERFDMDGNVWATILVSWLDGVSFVYDDTKNIAREKDMGVTLVPVMVLRMLKDCILYGIDIPGSEARSLHNQITDIREVYRRETSTLAAQLPDAYESLFAAAESFKDGVAELARSTIGSRVMLDSKKLRERVYNHIATAWFIFFFFEIRSGEKGRTRQSMFLEADSLMHGKDREMIIQAVEITHRKE